MHHDGSLRGSGEEFGCMFRPISLEADSMPLTKQIVLNKSLVYPIDRQPNETYTRSVKLFFNYKTYIP